MSVDQRPVEGKHEKMTPQVEAAIRRNIADVAQKNLSNYTFEKRHTKFPSAKFDVLVFDPSGRAVIEGREFTSRDVALWLRQESSATISLS